MQVPADEFRLPFFKEEGFNRRLCPICGLHYWTQDPEAKSCGDAPCIDYTFIGNPPTNEKYTVNEMREKFLSFFEKHSHKRISPYPVVARWRDDLMITIASIIDFQPYVTEGIIPPPANPLVISQPCIRFEDIDLAGYTAGRHLTFFEMGGHHAFNYEDHPQVYWKDQTIRYHHELLTKDLGVPSESVTYKEGLWIGGGNAGFDLEGCVNGLEISTLVFMMYRVVAGSFEPMPIKVVDTGYGIERWAWLSQGSPSAFHTIYGSLLDEVTSWAGISLDNKLLADTAKYSCRITTGQQEKERRRIASILKIDPDEFKKLLAPIESVYASLDHSKSLVFILSEGVVPSNVREGYLARLLYRRIYRLLKRIGIEDRLPDLLEAQIGFWGTSFPQLLSMKDEILEMVVHEEMKYIDTLTRGRGLVQRYLMRNKGEIPIDQLVVFYDSHGLTPEDVNESASELGVSVNVPDDFYSLVAMRHLGEIQEKEDSEKEELAKKIENLEPTKRLFYEEPYQQDFQANVISVVNGNWVVLDQTGFYSEGGGQLSDRGLLEKGTAFFPVKDVLSIEGVTLHRVEGASMIKVGDNVKGRVDWERRIALMRAHTATHLVLGASRRVLGDHAWQSGAQKGIETSRLDISHYKRLTRKEIEEIEHLANQVVTEGRPVTCKWMQRDEAEAIYGFRLYQGGAVPGKEIRVVEVEGGWDVEACGGTHLSNTSQVGLIKIVNTERVQDGVERLIYAVGPKALEEVQRREAILLDIAELLGVPIEKLRDSVIRNTESLKQLKHQLKEIRAEIASQIAKEFLGKAETIGDFKVIIELVNKSGEFLIEIGNILGESEEKVVAVMHSKLEPRLVVTANRSAIGGGANAGKLASSVTKIIGGGGGGKPYLGQGGGGDIEKFRESFNEIRKAIITHLS